MKQLTIYVTAVLIALLLIPALVIAEDGAAKQRDLSIWLGGHTTEFTDYSKKVGEYDKGEDEVMPEFMLNYFMKNGNRMMSLNGHFYDDENIDARYKLTIGNKFKAKIDFGSLVAQKGRDILENIGAKKGPKMLSHELLDEDADYKTKRTDIEGDYQLLLSKTNNIRLLAAHRSTIETGHEQKISTGHCANCHLVARDLEIDRQTHTVEAGIAGEAGKFDLAYLFGFRTFKSDADDAMNHYDLARHPTKTDANGDYVVSAGEFGPRLVYDDSTLPYGVYPETEKMSHKLKVKGDVGKGRFAGAISISQAKNKKTNLTTDVVSGAANYAVLLNPKTRLITKLNMSQVQADDAVIDLPTFREGTSAGPQIDFDYTFYSSLDRMKAGLTAEVIRKVNPKLTASLKAGYSMVDRDDYPVVEDGTKTSQLFGQLKLRYRKGLKYSSNIKYRFESISDPFVSARGLFEARARDDMTYTIPGFPFYFYHEREAYRYQDIITLPTQSHDIEWSSNWRPNSKVGINLGLKAGFDKNSDLDSLDVKQSSLQPSLSINYSPTSKISLTTGVSYTQYDSRGPVTVALFDG
ncbi:MAG: GSU2204 family CXXCH-containing (seleno)protein [bacterium]|nr:GSU2204 family CXXCH-containing (seleno)protein [bacterium]